MPRNFAKRIYGPYFPYNHGSKHQPGENGKQDLESKIELAWFKLISVFKKK
jgi:hypothetical protein